VIFWKKGDEVFETWVDVDEENGEYKEELKIMDNQDIREVYEIYQQSKKGAENYELNQKKSTFVRPQADF
jgi:hypothetical protein